MDIFKVNSLAPAGRAIGQGAASNGVQGPPDYQESGDHKK
jgi:hypothetical protein